MWRKAAGRGIEIIALTNWVFFQIGFLPYFTGFYWIFNKVSDNHLGIPKYFSQAGHLDFPFPTHELVVGIALLLRNLFCQKNGA